MLVAKMMGKDFDDLADIKGDHKDKKVFSETPVIEAEGIGHKGTIRPFDLKINKGEVIGLTGLLGSGRSELVRSIYGADKADSGTLKVNGKEVKINSPLDAMKLGMAYLPEDRLGPAQQNARRDLGGGRDQGGRRPDPCCRL